jgi:hypothetical protein
LYLDAPIYIYGASRSKMTYLTWRVGRDTHPSKIRHVPLISHCNSGVNSQFPRGSPLPVRHAMCTWTPHICMQGRPGTLFRGKQPVSMRYPRELRNVSSERRNVSLELRNVSLEQRNVSLIPAHRRRTEARYPGRTCVTTPDNNHHTICMGSVMCNNTRQ